jgi:hypothetical protein
MVYSEIHSHLSRWQVKCSVALNKFRLSELGKTLGSGVTIFLAAGLGSLLAEDVGTRLAGQLAQLFAPSLPSNVPHAAGMIAAMASGLTAAPKAIKLATKKANSLIRMEREILGAFKSGAGALRGAGPTGAVAFFLGGCFAGVLPLYPTGLVASLAVGIGAGLAATMGALITTFLSAMFDFTYRRGRARSREILRKYGQAAGKSKI